MKKAGRDRLTVQLQIREDDRDAERMDDIRFAGFPLLILMRLTGDLIRVLDQRHVR